MSVFTNVTHAELTAFLRQYPVEELVGFQGIGEGVENSNYYVDTADGRWVLTLFERLNYDDLPFFLGLMGHLAARGIPCPRPLATRKGATLTSLNGKPAAIVNRLHGQSELFVSGEQCGAVGALLADMHVAGQSYGGRCENPRGAAWRRTTAAELLPVIDRPTADLIRDELDTQAALDLKTLPQGVIHADLFKDNVLFVEQRLSGVIDFYYACVDALLYDLAVTVNDWCFDVHGQFVRERYDALMSEYRRRRELSAAERAAWPLTLRAGALRFFLSRLYDGSFPRDGDVVHVKDPHEYRRILESHRAGTPAL
jgi:homoserine kinase type II